MSWRPWAMGLFLLADCKPRPAENIESAVDAALAITKQAQDPGPGIDPERLELPVMDDLRQLEVARGAAQRRGTAAEIGQAFAAARPDPALSAKERARRYAQQASRRLSRMLVGRCTGELERLGHKFRVQALTAPLPEAPPGAEELRRRLSAALADSQLVAVKCEVGSIGMLLVPRGAGFRIIDVVPTGTGRGGPPTPE